MAKKEQQFLYDYRNDHSGESGKKLAKTAFILFIISALLVALSHFVLVEKKKSWKRKWMLLTATLNTARTLTKKQKH